MNADKRARLLVTGRVQGVGFRYFCARQARQRGLSGFARNEFDGSVTVEAQGPEAGLRDFSEALQIGPQSAIVDRIRLEWLKPVPGEYGFDIQ